MDDDIQPIDTEELGSPLDELPTPVSAAFSKGNRNSIWSGPSQDLRTPRTPRSPKSPKSPKAALTTLRVLSPNESLRIWSQPIIESLTIAKQHRVEQKVRSSERAAHLRKREQGFDNSSTSSAPYLPYKTVFDPHAARHMLMSSFMRRRLNRLVSREDAEINRELIEMSRGRLKTPRSATYSSAPPVKVQSGPLAMAISAPSSPAMAPSPPTRPNTAPAHRRRFVPSALPTGEIPSDSKTLLSRERSYAARAIGEMGKPIVLQPKHYAEFAPGVRSTAVNLRGPPPQRGAPHRAVFGPSDAPAAYHPSFSHHWQIGSNSNGVNRCEAFVAQPHSQRFNGDANFWAAQVQVPMYGHAALRK